MQDKRLTFDPMYGLRYQDKRRFPQGNPEHGRYWDKKQNCFISSPLRCKMGTALETSKKTGVIRCVPAPCHACTVAIRASEPVPIPQPKPQLIARKRLTGLEIQKAFFRP